MKRSTKLGMALLATLAIITILTVLLLSFLSSVQLDRQSTANYSQVIKAQEIGLGALQEITSDLLQEIDAGSSEDNNPARAVYSFNNVRVYIPKTNRSMLPARIGYPATEYGIEIGAGKIPPALVRVSRANDNFYTSPPTADYSVAKLPPNRASAVSTRTISANGRTIAVPRWNRPMLTGTTLPQAFQENPPEWVYVTRSGSRVCTNAEAQNGELILDPAGTKVNAVLGRYSYVLYEVGGLLDINIASYPSTISNTQADVRAKSFVSYVDLTQIPGLNNPGDRSKLDEFIQWRNKGGLTANAGDYISLVKNSATDGFVKAYSAFNSSLNRKDVDNPLISRQDFIEYAKTVGLDNNALAYLTCFSRAVNSPSWMPVSDSPNSSYAYFTKANVPDDPADPNDGSNNPALANVRKPDGSPLLQKRFPLKRLGLITSAATADTGSDIYKYFGLQRSAPSASWTYNHGQASRILSLAEVSRVSPPREPDFFELLKAGILNGSLGAHPGVGSYSPGPTGAFFDQYSSVADSHIIQIGANIIDQQDADSYPTPIYFVADAYMTLPPWFNPAPAMRTLCNTFRGIENLPYLSALHPLVFGRASSNTLRGWVQPSIWNPHQGPRPADAPIHFRIRTHGTSRVAWNMGSPWTFPWSGTTPTIDYSTPSGASFGLLLFDDSTPGSFFDRPVILTTSNIVSAGNPANQLWQSTYGGSNRFAGICTGIGSFQPPTPTPTMTPNPRQLMAIPLCDPSLMTVVLEYEYPPTGSNDWRPYNLISRLRHTDSDGLLIGSISNTGAISYHPTATEPYVAYTRADPRTDRFSVSGSWIGASGAPGGSTIRPDGGASYNYWIHPPATTPGSGVIANPASLARFVNPTIAWRWSTQNTTSGGACYVHPDGVTRPADGFRGDSSTGEGCPTFHSGSPAGTTNQEGRRPIILNRPFRCVGELGYAFRDEPFKTLDFWSPESADGGLLDLFCIEPEPEIVAGQVNPNTASKPVLQAILAGAAKKERDASSNIIGGGNPSPEAPALAAAIANNILGPTSSPQPIRSRAELVTQLSAVINGAFPLPADRANKAYAEAPVRALSAVSNTRTWNLLFDVIAQSGRMSPRAREVGDFIVEGEKRYWLHVAIDRFTGKVISQQLEPVYE